MGTFKYLTLDEAEQYVEKTYGASWDGWVMLIHRPNPAGFFRKNGAFKNGRWNTEVRIQPNSQGLYKVRS